MAPNETYRERRVDATPYSGCAIVALIILVILVLGFMLLWNIGGAVKHWTWTNLPSATSGIQKQIEDAISGSPSVSTDSLLEQGQKAVQDQIDAAKNDAATAAEQAAKDALNQGIQDGSEQLRELLP